MMSSSRTRQSATTSSAPTTSGTSWTRTCSVRHCSARSRRIPAVGGLHAARRSPSSPACRSSPSVIPMMIIAAHRDATSTPRVGGAAESGGGSENPQTRDDEQAGAVRLPARRPGRRARSCRWRSSCTGCRNNIWTYGQQHYVFGQIEKEEEAAKKRRKRRARRTLPNRGPVRIGRSATAVPEKPQTVPD